MLVFFYPVGRCVSRVRYTVGLRTILHKTPHHTNRCLQVFVVIAMCQNPLSVRKHLQLVNFRVGVVETWRRPTAVNLFK